jgi:hypothetical protein
MAIQVDLMNLVHFLLFLGNKKNVGKGVLYKDRNERALHNLEWEAWGQDKMIQHA